MDQLLLCGCLALFITFFSLPVIIVVAKEKKLFDEPENRKIHTGVIPNLGGLGLFAGFIISNLLCAPPSSFGTIQYLLAAITVIFFLGLKDDILIISASKKFIGQLIASIIVMKFADIQIHNLHGFFGIEQISEINSSILSILTIILITNSFNLIDGIDGLAASLGILSCSFWALFFYTNGDVSYALIAFSLVSCLTGFLMYNFPPAKIFMGDTGSLILGFVNAILVIKCINTPFNSEALIHFKSAPAIGFAVLILPVFDALRVFTIRIIKKRSPFSPDRNHVHHLIYDLANTHRNTTLICLIINALLLLIAFYLNDIGTTQLFGLLFSIVLCLFGILYYLQQSKKSRQTYPLVSDTVNID